MSHTSSTKYKKYYGSRCSDDLTDYAERQIKRIKDNQNVNYQQVREYFKYYYEKRIYSFIIKLNSLTKNPKHFCR